MIVPGHGLKSSSGFSALIRTSIACPLILISFWEKVSVQPEPEQPKGLDGRAVTGGSWAAVDVSALADDASIRAAAQQLKAQGADYGLVTLKTPDGSISLSPHCFH